MFSNDTKLINFLLAALTVLRNAPFFPETPSFIEKPQDQAIFDMIFKLTPK